MNLVERWFAELTSKWLKHGTHRSVPELTGSIQTWIDTWNDHPRPFVWTKTADQILDSSPAISNESLGNESLGQDTLGQRWASPVLPRMGRTFRTVGRIEDAVAGH